MSDDNTLKRISFNVNGNDVLAYPKSHSNLLAFLRSELQLHGTKLGCATGNCGACTVIIDGVATQSCQVGLTALEKCSVETIENVVRSKVGKKITAALIDRDAAQCGYCLPGIVVAAYAEFQKTSKPDPAQALQRNLCRCGTHTRILTALRDVITEQENPV